MDKNIFKNLQFSRNTINILLKNCTGKLALIQCSFIFGIGILRFSTLIYKESNLSVKPVTMPRHFLLQIVTRFIIKHFLTQYFQLFTIKIDKLGDANPV